MLSMDSEYEPNIFVKNKDDKSFNLYTVTTGEERHYRIIKETNSGFFYYDFKVDLSDKQQIELFTVNIPYVKDNFVNSIQNNPTTVNFLDTNVEGEKIDKAVYKLIYFNRDDYDKQIPSKIELNKDYNYGNSNIIRFIYYRILGNQTYLTGYLGNRYLDNEIEPDFNFDSEEDYFVETITTNNKTIKYLFIKVSSTPNIIISDIETESFDKSFVYEKDGYKYTMTIPGDGLQKIGFRVFLEVLNISSNLNINNIVSFVFESNTKINVLGFKLPKNNSNSYTFDLIPDEIVSDLSFKIFKS